MNFLEALLPLLPGLRATWSEGRYVLAASTDGKAVAAKEKAGFNPSILTNTLHSALFDKCASMVFRVELVAKKLGSWAEGCVCHRTLFDHAGEQLGRLAKAATFRKSCLERHFGRSVKTCPMAGLQAPELVAGRLEELFA